MSEGIRRAHAGDAPALARFMGAVYADFREPRPPAARIEAFFRAQLEKPDGLEAFVSVEGDRLVGLVTLAFAPTTQGLGTFAWVDDFHVAAGLRGRGRGEALLRAAAARARERGAGELRLSAAVTPRLGSLYARAGFRDAGLSLLTRELPADEHDP